MIFLSILILIVAKALISNNNLSPILYPRITAIIFIYAGVLSLNTLYIQSIGSGIGIYSGLFHITSISQFIESFIYLLISYSLVLIFSNLPKILNKFMCNSLPKIFNSNNYFNFFTIIVIIISTYYAFYDVTMVDLLAILIFFFMSLLVNSFILNNFKFSKIFIVKILQKILFTFIALIIFIYLLLFFLYFYFFT